MATLIKPEPICVPPSYSCFFEQAEQLIESLFEGKELVIDDTLTDNIRLVQHASTFITDETLQNALQIKALKRRVRLAQMLQPELVEAFHRISTRL